MISGVDTYQAHRGARNDEGLPQHVRQAHDLGLAAIERNASALSADANDRLDDAGEFAGRRPSPPGDDVDLPPVTDS